MLGSRSDRALAKLAELLLKNVDFNNALLYATGRGSSSNKRLEILGAALKEVLNA